MRFLPSVRSRLVLGNSLVLTLILAGFAVVLRYCAGIWMAQELDRDLNALARPLTSRFSTGILYRLREQVTLDIPGLMNELNRPPEGGRLPLRALDVHRKRFLIGDSIEPYDESGYRQALAGRKSFGDAHWEGEQIRVLSVPLEYQGKVKGVLQVARSVTERQRQLDYLTSLLLMLLPAALLVAGAGGWYMTTRVLQPVRAITLAASQIEARALSERLPVSGTDEFAELSRTFNAMLVRIESAFVQQRRFTADASHELRTPLAAIMGDASLALAEDRDAMQYRQALQDIAASAQRMHRIVQDLLVLARSREGGLSLNWELLHLESVVSQAVEQLQKATPVTCEIQRVFPPNGSQPIVGDPYYLERLFINLLENAVRHTPASGRITITVEPHPVHVVVTVADTGEGIAPEHLLHVFDSFYRADASRARLSGGTGLGLPIARSIVEAHRGQIVLHSAIHEGTTVTVTLPTAHVSQEKEAE